VAAGASLAVVLVHYHTPALVAEAMAALARDLQAEGERGSGAEIGPGEVEWLLVDNGSDAAGREILASLPVRLLEPGRNLGFAGGVNLGVASASAPLLLLMNPDVLVLPGCVGALMKCLRAGAAAAGPRFYWDSGRRFLLPPTEVRTRRDEVLSWLATARGGRWAEWARRRSRAHCRRHWAAAAAIRSYALSGSLLAVTRDAWQRVGGFDERYRLYFEETDWLMRLRRAGLEARFVPQAEAVHLVGRSAAAEGQAGRWFEDSARRFRRRYYGEWFAQGLERAARWGAARGWGGGGVSDRRGEKCGDCGSSGETGGDGGSSGETAIPPDGLDLGGYPRPVWMEVSPRAEGFPAAAEQVANGQPERWRLPPDIEQRLAGETWHLTVTDDRGRELGRYRFDVADRSGARGSRSKTPCE
jgi:N-acetylglucosaminyl-diphospho-decaprenol L-rhamnosyltransferase